MHHFGRADEVDRDGLRRLVNSINRVLEAGDAVADGSGARPEIAIERVFKLGVVRAARRLWEDLGIGVAIRRGADGAGLTAPHETALFARAAQRLEQPGSKLACATNWLPDVAFLPAAEGLSVDQLYRALDFLVAWSEAIERDVVLQAADLFRRAVDLVFDDTTPADFEIAAADDEPAEGGGRLYAPLRRRGHSKEGRDSQPQVIVALAVPRDGMPVRSWVLPGDTADVATVARIKADRRVWRLGRCVFVGDAGMYSAATLWALSRGLGRSILATPRRKLSAVEGAVLSRPGRSKPVADNLQIKAVVAGDGERRRRYVLCLNPQEAARQRRDGVLDNLAGELDRRAAREADHPKAACALLAARRDGRDLTPDDRGRPRLDPAKVKAAATFAGQFVVITNDDTRSAADVALGDKGAWIIESCCRRLQPTGPELRPIFHWSPRRIEAHVKLCVLALQMPRAAAIRCTQPWARIAHELAALKAIRYPAQGRAIVQRTKIPESLGEILKSLGISTPQKIISGAEPAPELTPA